MRTHKSLKKWEVKKRSHQFIGQLNRLTSTIEVSNYKIITLTLFASIIVKDKVTLWKLVAKVVDSTLS